MSRANSYACEPLRAWNRLEPRPRTAEFDKALECSIHDPLWMLTRQWQFGEFQGEDTGSAIFAKIYMQSAPITKIKTPASPAQAYTDGLPLEQRVERQHWIPDYRSRVEAAFVFMKCLDRAALQFAVPDYDRTYWKNRLRQYFPLPATADIADDDSGAEMIQKAETLSNEARMDLSAATGARYFDGLVLFDQLLGDIDETVGYLTSEKPAHASMLTAAGTEFKNWHARNYYSSYNQVEENAWIPRQMEYQFHAALPEAAAVNTVVSAQEYYNGTMDWYSFDVNKAQSVPGLSGLPTAAEKALIKNELLTVIPREAKFAGAPNSRWWQFENGNIDLGNISAGTTDIAKLIFTEYALLYNTDWLLVPYPVPVGTICDVKGIIVTDVFGEQSFVAAATQGQTDNWAGWGMFNMSTTYANGLRNQPVDTRTFIPPVTVKSVESEPLEEVHFLRDEMSNHVWAVEVKVPDNVGGAMDGHTYAKQFSGLLQQFDDTPAPVPDSTPPMFRYSLANTVPENWIPFIPVHVEGGNRAIQLQRAAMPRLFRNGYTHVRPRTQLLRHGISFDNSQPQPYFINEEEVPRAGIQLKASFQRTRWYNGAVVNWYGYRKQVGRGEGSSGLKYDKVEEVQQ